ncbi:MAG: hypothetical protein Q4C48_01445 [Lachnospiraceae bacterium]|nr:hypothetical protein [Lachnospiraceae bacterium]
MRTRNLIGIFLLLCFLLAGCRTAENDGKEAPEETPALSAAAQPSEEPEQPEKTAVLNGALLLGEYRGLTYAATDVEPSEAEIEAQLAALAALYGAGTELTDELIAEHFPEYSTVTEYREAVRQALRQQKEEETLRDKRRQLLARLIDSAVLQKDVSQEVAAYRGSLLDFYRERAAVAGETLADYCSRELAMDEAAFESYLTEAAETYIRGRYCLRGVAELEGLAVSEETYETMLPALAQENGYEAPAEFAEDYSKDVIRDMMLCELAFQVVLETAAAE